MKRMKFRFLACVAMVLACVMFFEVPVSAASAFPIANYYYDSSTDGRFDQKRYYFPYGEHDMFSISGLDSTYKNVNFGTSDDPSVEFNFLDMKQCTIKFYPLSDFEMFEFRDHFTTPSVSGAPVDSFIVKANFLLFSSHKVSINPFVSFAFYKNGTRVDSRDVSKNVVINAGEYKDYVLEYDLLSNLSYEDFDSFTIRYVFNVYPPTSDYTFGVSPLNSIDSELDGGISFTLKHERVQEAPVFNRNLSSDQVTYLVGTVAQALTVNASVSDGGVISYQWYKAAKASAAGTVISGATGNSYVPDTTTESDCYYYCVATSTLSGEQKTSKSKIAHVTVVKKPQKPQVVSDLNNGAVIEYFQDRPAGDMVFGVLSPDGGTLTYQWYRNSRSSPDGGTPIIGATSSVFTPSTAVLGTTYYYCIATNTKAIYSESVTSGVVGVRVVSPPDPAKSPVITSDLSPGPVTYTEGDAASPLRIGATSPDGGVLTYQWFELIDGVGTTLAGEVYPSFTPPTGVPGEYQYYCVVTNTFFDTTASVTSSVATIVVEEDLTDSLLGSIIGGVSDIIDGILNLPQLIIDGIKSLFIPDAEAMAAYQDKWFELLASRFGAIYEAVVLIDEFGQAISDQAKQGIITFPEVTLNLAGTPWTFGGWDVKVVPDGFDGVIVTLKSAINIVCTFAFVNGLRHRFEGVIGGA